MDRQSLFDRILRPERAMWPAVLFEHREYTYAELRSLTIETAEKLNSLRLRQGDRIAILLNDSPEFMAAFLAVISLGGIAVPINMALRTAEQLFILRDCGARAAIVEAQTAETLFEGSGATSESLSPNDLRDLLVVSRGREELPSLARRVNIQRVDRAEREASANEFPVSGRHESDAFILYTSGSTGEPKGAVHSQSDICYTNETYGREVLRLRESDRLFSSSRLPFAYGLGNAFTFPLLNGYTTILCREKPTPEIIAGIFREYRPTIFFGVPVVFRMLLDYHWQAFRAPISAGWSLAEKHPTEVGALNSRNPDGLNTSSLRLCISAGEALPAQLGEEWQKTFGVEVLDGIGSTEMLHMFISNHEDDLRYGSSGKLLRGYEAKLIDHEGVVTPSGEVGNLWIRGASAASRYWQRPDVSQQTFVDGWVRTGDLYRCDADGLWWHMGRSDDCFKPTGQWVSPVEVESVLVRSDQVRAAAIVEGFDRDGLSCVCAFVVRANENDADETIEQSLRMLCDRALPRFKRPRRYIFVSELPYTATGKVQRFKLREQLRSQAA
jgi:benzoate-CoA ligase